jgi:hypothetical protein
MAECMYLFEFLELYERATFSRIELELISIIFIFLDAGTGLYAMFQEFQLLLEPLHTLGNYQSNPFKISLVFFIGK